MRHTSRDLGIDFTTPAIDLDALITPRSEMPPLFATKLSQIVDFLVEYRINILFVIGGDGTLRGAQAIVKEITARDLKISVIGIPKTIDNDLEFMDKSFGFETAFAEDSKALIESAIVGREIECGVLSGRNGEPSSGAVSSE